MKLALFDLDHTLMPSDASEIWLWLVTKRSNIDPRPFAQASARFLDEYHRGVLDINEFMRYQLAFLRRFPRHELDTYLKDYLDHWVTPYIPQASRDLVDSHRKAGDRTLICTATYTYVSRPIAALFGMDGVIASDPEVDECGEFTGRLTGDISFQQGKVRMVRAYIEEARREGVVFDQVVFYSDSINDRPLFEFVEEIGGQAVAVNADEALRTLAQERHWRQCQTFTEAERLTLRSKWKNAL